jgi:hypothetical protein
MPFRSRATLDDWIDEFRALGYPIAGELRVIEQDGGEGANTGLVVVELRNTPTSVFIQPVVQGSSHWTVSFEPREDTVELDPPGVAALSAELAVVSALCAFLQAKAATFSAGSPTS